MLARILCKTRKLHYVAVYTNENYYFREGMFYTNALLCVMLGMLFRNTLRSFSLDGFPLISLQSIKRWYLFASMAMQILNV